jgi:gliding motility-associated-like protein
MKRFLFILLYFLFIADFNSFSQKKYCADSSIRIKYNFNYSTVQLFNREDTNGKNTFAGVFGQSANPIRGIPLFRTNWGDSIYWAKKFYLNNTLINCTNIFEAPNGTLICNGVWGSSSNLLLCRIDTNGNLLWAKRYWLTQFPQGGYFSGSSGTRNSKNVLITSDAIYFTANFAQRRVVVKLDLGGNILWSKSFTENSSLIGGLTTHAPVIFNDTLLFVSNMDGPSGPFPVLTKLDANTGALIESYAYKTTPDPVVKGIFSDFMHLNNDNSFSLAGKMIILYFGQLIQSDFTFNLSLDKDLNPLNSSYYDFNPLLNLVGLNFTFDFNRLKQNIFLYDVVFGNDKYFVSFDQNKNIIRSRKFLIPPSVNTRSSINFDDKQNIHFTYNYQQNNKAVIEYARISDLAAANTVSCFGIDTSILQPVPFTLTKEPFTWDLEYTNIVSSFPVNLLQAPDTITKQVICKQVSYCDSLKIKGNSSVCIAGPDVRYSVYLNPQCLKSINWQIDTSFATLINAEGDSAVTLRFKKCGNFYLKAAVNNCVVNDSLFITIPAPQTDLQLNKTDTVLCPGETILLNVNPLFKTYQWQDGSSQNTYTVTSPGLYTITATDSCGNVVTDNININPDNTVIPGSTFYKICVYDTANMLLPANISNITWLPPSFGMLRGNRLLFYPMQTTAYTIQAQSPQGCSIQKQITVETEVCPEWVRFPSAFTPNNDGLNDSFRPGVSGHLVSYNLKVFDRYGQIVFSSKNPYAGWDGTIKGVQQNSGVFVFMCYHRFINKAEVMQKGTLMLIR